MVEVDPEVAALFKSYLAGWKDALARWQKKCSGKIEENKQRMKSSYPVADRRAPRSGFKDPNAPVSDATPYGYPSKSLADQKKDDEVGNRAAKCKKMIEYIQQTIGLLNNARTTGVFNSGKKMKLWIREKPTWLQNSAEKNVVSRGEKLEIIKLQGDWMLVRAQGSKEGWVNKVEIMPVLPVELSSVEGGKGAGETSRDEVEVGGARDTVIW